MKKKLISLLLTGALATSMAAVAATSVSAAVVNGRYEPSEGTETYRYYFYMPEEWENELSTEAACYWWAGTDACGALDGSGGTTAWPGYLAQKGDAENIFYVDCPIDVTGIIWSNNIDGGTDTESAAYKLSVQTSNIGSEYYDEDESEYIPEGTENFDNMIYVCDKRNVTLTETSQKPSYGGSWFYYYGNGEYGVYPTREEAETAGEILNTEYYPPVDPNATPDQATPTDPAGPADPTNPGQPSTDATSGTNPAGTSTADTTGSASNNSAVQTGAASLAVALFAILSAITGVVVLTRKKFD